MATIYRKTAKAQAEIDTRAHRLVPRLRTALILVDGKRSDDELRKMIMLQADETLGALLEQGFIEVAGEVVAAPPKARPAMPAAAAAPRAADAPASVLPGTRSFEPWRRDAVRHFTDLVGPMGEVLAMKMERTRSADELRPLLDTARQIIGNSRGAALADEFAARFIGAPLAA